MILAPPFVTGILVVLALAAPLRAVSQEVDPVEPSPSSGRGGGGGPGLAAAWLYVRVGASDNRSLVSPQGLGAGAHVRLKERVGLRIDAGRTHARVDRTGRTCHRIEPIDNSCTNEAITGSTSLTSVEVAMTLSFDVAGPVGFGLGLGPVVGVIDSDSRGVSGRMADVALPKTAHLGLGGVAELRVAPEAFPLFLTAGVRFQRIHVDGCLGDPPFTEEPFCGPLQLRWGQLELGWRR